VRALERIHRKVTHRDYTIIQKHFDLGDAGLVITDVVSDASNAGL